jgi:hypothetical protein
LPPDFLPSASYVPYVAFSVNMDAISSSGKYAASLMSTTAFGLGVHYLAYQEEQGGGVQVPLQRPPVPARSSPCLIKRGDLGCSG